MVDQSFKPHVRVCKHRIKGARQLPIENGLTICALELDISTFSAVEVDHFTLRICARELDNYG